MSANWQEIFAIIQLLLSGLVLPLLKILWDIKVEIAKLRLELAKDYLLKSDFDKYRDETAMTLTLLEAFVAGQQALQKYTREVR